MCNSAVRGQILPTFELRYIMVVLHTCKYEEDPIKNEDARVLTRLYVLSLLPARMKKIQSKMNELECLQDFPNYKSMGIFSDAQGQLTPQSLVESG